MESWIRNWTLCGALTLAFIMGTASALAGVSFFGIMVRILVGVSIFLTVGGVVGGWIGRSLVRRMVESETEESGR